MRIFTEFIKNPFQTAYIVPSSVFAVRELTQYISTHSYKEKINILEIGSGTGTITKKIVSQLREHDTLDVIEINPEFCQLLHQQFQNHHNVNIHCLSILDWHPSYTYDIIISTLPFNLFNAEHISAIVEMFKKYSTTGTTISYIDCFGISFLKSLFATKENKADIAKKNNILNSLRKQYGIKTTVVVFNIPPAYIHHLVF